MKTTQTLWMRRIGAALVSGAALCSTLVLPIATHAAPSQSAQTSGWLQGWPMVGHDPQRTNRSPDIGPAHPRLLFTTSLIGGPALVGADGSFYGWGPGGLRAVDHSGRSRWVVPVQGIEGGSPALAPDGLLLVNGMMLSGKGTATRAGMAVVAIAANGRQRWAIHALPWAPHVGGTFYSPSGQPIPMGQSVPLSKGVAPLVTPAGRLYMPFVGPGASNAGVEAIAPTGRLLRRLLPNVEPSVIAWAQDGTLYELGRQGLAALTPTGALRWEQPIGATRFPGSVLVGSHGTIYASKGPEVVAFSPAGRLLWQRDIGAVVDVLAERVDGVVLAVSAAGLSAIAPQGTQLWYRALGRPPATTASSPSIAVDALGRAYVGGADGLVRAIAPDGAVLWTLRAGGPTNPGATPSVALGPRGTLVVAGTDGHLRVYR